MIMRIKNHPGILLVAAVLILAVPGMGHADNLFRLFPEFQANGFYGDNIGLRSNNEIGDFGTTMVAGFFLDYTSEARYASLHYDTFAQLFLHRTQFDRAGEGQSVSASDDENISPTTHLRFYDFFYRDAPTETAVTTSDQSPAFNTTLTQLLLVNFNASVNHFSAVLTHAWGRGWTSEFSVHQTTFWANGDNNSTGTGYTTYGQGASGTTEYHFNDRFALGAGYRYYDFQFTHPGTADAQAHWPFALANWYPTKNLYLSGTAGVVINHTQGMGEKENFAGIGQIEYNFYRGHLSVWGGQEPDLVTAGGGLGVIRGVRGRLTYDITQRLTGYAGGAFYNSSGTGFNADLVSWGVGLTQRVNQYASVYARFVQIRVDETSSNENLFPTAFQNGKEAVGDYYIIGFTVAVEAFRWSWQ
jgi:hypothetical protein